MKFWDASAVVPLLVPEAQSEACAAVLGSDPVVVAWALTPVEILSALHRKRRDGSLSTDELNRGRRRLESLRLAWHEVRDVDLVRIRAERLLGVHALRAADALQLAAALVTCSEDPRALPLVCLDQNLADAAGREGFEVLS